MIRLIATDLDGTLATHEGKIPSDAFQVIREVTQKGIVFAVATGRQTASVENDFKEVLEHIYVIAENGGVVRQNGEDVHATYLDHGQAIEVIRKLKKIPDIYFIVCCKDRAYMNRDCDLFEEEIKKYYHSRSYKADIDQIEEPIVKIAIYDPVDVTKEIEPFVIKNWGEDFLLTLSGINWLDMGSKAINKGLAVKALQEKFNITREESMAFGDYYNDVEMFKQVEHSYAMSHTLEEIKAYATYEAPTGGVLDIIRNTISS